MKYMACPTIIRNDRNLPSQIFRACHRSGALSATTQVPWQDSQRAQGPRTWCVGATPLPSRPHFERAPNRAMISYKGLYQWAKYSGKMTHLPCSYNLPTFNWSNPVLAAYKWRYKGVDQNLAPPKQMEELESRNLQGKHHRTSILETLFSILEMRVIIGMIEINQAHFSDFPGIMNTSIIAPWWLCKKAEWESNPKAGSNKLLLQPRWWPLPIVQLVFDSISSLTWDLC